MVRACCAWAATSPAVLCCTGRKAPAAKASCAQVCSLFVQVFPCRAFPILSSCGRMTFLGLLGLLTHA